MLSAKFLLVASHGDSLVNFRGALIESLQVKGFIVHVAAPDLSLSAGVRSQLESKGVVVHKIKLQRTGVNPFADLCFFYCLLRLIREVRPSHLLTYTIKPVIYGSIAGLVLRVPRRFALITGLGYAFSDLRGVGTGLRVVGFISKVLYYCALNSVSVVFLQNRDDEVLLRSLGIVRKTTSTIIVNGSGVDLVSFSHRPVAGGTAQRFLLIARLLGAKGVREYVGAARRVKGCAPDAKFLLAGWIDEGNPDSISRNELEGWMREGIIDFLGKLDDVRPELTACSVFVLPSYREGTPRTVLEAMSIGRAIITTDAPGCRETVEDGRNGFLVSVRSVEELVAAMRRFIDDPGLSAAMGVESRRIAERRYDVHKVNAAMMSGMGIH